MKEVTFTEAIQVMKEGKTVFYGHDEVSIKSEISDIGYEVSFDDLINGKWFINI